MALTLTAVVLLVTPVIYLSMNAAQPPGDAGLRTVRAYLRAVYARDFTSSYRYISSPDRRVRDQASYVKSQANYTGFAAQVARQLAGYGDIRILKQTNEADRPHIEIAYRFPAPEDLAPLVLNWDEEKLNGLSLAERRRLLDALQQRQRDRKLVMVQGQEGFDLIKEDNAWRIFFDWAGGLKVKLSAIPPAATIDVRFTQQEIVVTSDEPFQVNLIVKNRGKRALTFVVAHQVDPNNIIGQLEMIECGLSGPVTLDSGSEREFTMAYLLSSEVRHSIKEIALTYRFRLMDGIP